MNRILEIKSNSEPLTAEYWAHSVDPGGRIVYFHKTTDLCHDHKLNQYELRTKVKATVTLNGQCGRCERDLIVTVLEASRTSVNQTLSRHYQEYCWENSAWCCAECKEILKAEQGVRQQAYAAEAAEHQKNATAAAEQRRAKRRVAIQVEYGKRFISDCPSCDTGFLVVKLNARAMRPFIGCTSYNPQWKSCDHTQPLAIELHREMLDLFEERLVHSKSFLKSLPETKQESTQATAEVIV